jgi:hypothetical protein
MELLPKYVGPVRRNFVKTVTVVMVATASLSGIQSVSTRKWVRGVCNDTSGYELSCMFEICGFHDEENSCHGLLGFTPCSGVAMIPTFRGGPCSLHHEGEVYGSSFLCF